MKSGNINTRNTEKDIIIDLNVQGRQTRQNSGGVADLTKGGLQKI